LVAREFLAWLNLAAESAWLDVGCGTGALSQSILAQANPRSVRGIDRSEGFVQYARRQTSDPRAQFDVGDAQALTDAAAAYDAAVSGLVLNFVPSPPQMLAEMARVTRPGGTVAVYVWDYADRMQFMRYFWDAAAVLDPADSNLDEGSRFPICRPDALGAAFRAAGLHSVEVRAIDIPTHFSSFDDYWSPFLGGQGAAPSYLMSLSEAQRLRLREYLREHLPTEADGSIRLIARAWAARGIVPD
jgi:trans-aconitate methyltransferase